MAPGAEGSNGAGPRPRRRVRYDGVMPRKRLPRHPRRRPRGPRRDPFADAEEQTQAILQHERAVNAATVAARAEQGRLLLEARARIPHGSWRAYVATKLPISRATADRAIDLFHFRERHPELFEKLRAVSLSVAYLLIDLPVDELATFLGKAHPIPKLGVSKTPSAMHVSDVMEVLWGGRDRREGPDVILRSRRASRAAIREIQNLIDQRDRVEVEAVAELYEELTRALAALGAAFELEGE